MNRRKFVSASLATAATAALTSTTGSAHLPTVTTALFVPWAGNQSVASPVFWPNGARLAISLSLQFEAGGQPISGASGLIPEPIAPGYPDLATNSYFDYGIQEGTPRLLNLFDKHGVKATSFMVGQAVDTHPELAREIVRRGHEAAAHGQRWDWQYKLPPAEERAWIQSSHDSIVRATGQRPSGYDCYWMRGSVHTQSLLQEIGFTYHNNDLSRDEPYLQDLNGKPFVTIPYTIHLNDIGSYNFPDFSPQAYEQQLKDEFDQLYEEGATRRRMMAVSFHDRISGHASRVWVIDRFLTYARQHKGIWFARKDEIARYALATPEITPRVVRAAAGVSGLAGNTGQ